MTCDVPATVLQFACTPQRMEWVLVSATPIEVVIPFDGMEHFRNGSACWSALMQSLEPLWAVLCAVERLVVEWRCDPGAPPAGCRAVETVARLVAVTHQHYRRLAAEAAAAHLTHVLYLIPDDSVVLSAFAEASRQRGDLVCERRFSTGYNPVTRAFDPQPPFDFEVWVRELLQQHIRVVVTHNVYFEEMCAAGGILIVPLLAWCGVEWITCDFDLYEPDWHARRAFLGPPHQVCAVEWLSQRDWQTLYPQHQPAPLIIRLAQAIPNQVVTVADDAPLVLASHPRLAQLVHFLPYILCVLESCSPHAPYADLTRWFYAQRRMILRVDPAPAAWRCSEAIARLYMVYLNALTWLRYALLDELTGRWPVHIYGVSEWDVLFPDLYQHRYLSEPDYQALFRSGRAIGLLANQHSTYLGDNPVFARALELGAPFFCYNTLLCLPEWQGFRSIEYGSADALLQKLPHTNAIWCDPVLQQCCRQMQALHRDAADAWGDFVRQPAGQRRMTGEFVRQQAAHVVAWDGLLDAYIGREQSRLQADFFRLFVHWEDAPFRIEQSRYANYPVLQRVRQWAEDQGTPLA